VKHLVADEPSVGDRFLGEQDAVADRPPIATELAILVARDAERLDLRLHVPIHGAKVTAQAGAGLRHPPPERELGLRLEPDRTVGEAWLRRRRARGKRDQQDAGSVADARSLGASRWARHAVICSG
jgi:hypothetical protein